MNASERARRLRAVKACKRCRHLRQTNYLGGERRMWCFLTGETTLMLARCDKFEMRPDLEACE